jgi:hypothetical protein
MFAVPNFLLGAAYTDGVLHHLTLIALHFVRVRFDLTRSRFSIFPARTSAPGEQGDGDKGVMPDA